MSVNDHELEPCSHFSIMPFYYQESLNFNLENICYYEDWLYFKISWFGSCESEAGVKKFPMGVFPILITFDPWYHKLKWLVPV